MWVCILTRQPEFISHSFHPQKPPAVAHYDQLSDLLEDLESLPYNKEDAQYKVFALNLQDGSTVDVSAHYPKGPFDEVLTSIPLTRSNATSTNPES